MLTRAADGRRPAAGALLAHDGGVRGREGVVEAALDLMRAADRHPLAIVAIPHERGPEAVADRCGKDGIPLVSVSAVASHVRRSQSLVRLVTECRLPFTSSLPSRIRGYRSDGDGAEYVVVIAGDVAGRAEVPVHLHARCQLGDALGSVLCGCGYELEQSMDIMKGQRAGIVVYFLEEDRARLDDPAHGGGIEKCADYDIAAQLLTETGARSFAVAAATPAPADALRARDLDVAGWIRLDGRADAGAALRQRVVRADATVAAKR
jgi:GTP cyclohydrolase II